MLNIVVFISYHNYWDFWELDSESSTLLKKEKTTQKRIVGLQLGGLATFLFKLAPVFTCFCIFLLVNVKYQVFG